MTCKVAAVIVVLLAIPCCLVAQSTNATITGRIIDQSKAAIVGANVVATNVDTGVQQSTTTGPEGLYTIVSLMPGNYKLEVQKQGFRTVVKPDIVLHVQDISTINFEMSVGAFSESITVTGGAPQVDTESSSVSTVVDHQFVENLPLNGRSFNTLLQLTPGVVIAPSNVVNQGQFSIAGQRSSSNNFLVDGASANFGVSPFAGVGASGTGSAQAFSVLGGTSSLVSVEALQEFRVETSSFAPEFGRTPGGQVVLTTRSGTNKFHGGIYEYFRNTVMDANDWFANSAANPRAPEHHNDFGGFLGGPIWKARTFFFLSYEGARLDQPATTSIQVPYLTNTVPACTAPSAIAPFLEAFPKPNGSVSAATCTGQYTGTFSNPTTLNAGSVRLDHTFNSKFSIFGRYNDAPSQAVLRAGSVSEVDTIEVGTRTLTLGGTMMFSPQISNSVRGNYSLQAASFVAALSSFGGAVPPSLDILGPQLPSPGNSIFSFGTFDTNTYAVGPSAHNRSRQVNLADDLAITRGAHQAKVGVDYRTIYLDARPVQASLNYFVSSVSNFLATQEADFGISSSSTRPSYVLARSTSLYAQDTWKVTPRLTINYGLRWELSPAPSGRSGTTLAAWENVDNPAQLALAPVGTRLWGTRYSNFAPRVGVAYSLSSKGDLVLRAGWGMFYDLASDTVGSLAGQFPNAADEFSAPAVLPLADARPYIPTLSLQPPYPQTTQGFAPGLSLPRSYQWNVALQKSFEANQTFSVTYVGQAGRDLLRQEGIGQPNANFPAGGVFLLTENNAHSNYNALQVQYRRPVSSGLQALLNYTWSHSLDNASNDSVEAVSSAVISAAKDYGPSDFDVRNTFSGALTYVTAAPNGGPWGRLLRDWSVATVIVARSGFPFNASVATETIAGARPRPDLVPGEPIWISNPGAGGGKSLNPAAFAMPHAGQQGSEGRNDIAGFGLVQVDFSFGRKFTFAERFNLQFRADAFNLLNHPNFTNPYGLYISPTVTPYLQSTSMLNQGLGGLNPLFQVGGPRSLQLSLKLTF